MILRTAVENAVKSLTGKSQINFLIKNCCDNFGVYKALKKFLPSVYAISLLKANGPVMDRKSF